MSFYKEILEHLIYEFKSESELIKSISTISEAFTIRRDKLEEYLQNPSLVAAYTAFYFTTNYPKLGEIIKKLPLLEGLIQNSEMIEIGSGPGSFSFPMEELTQNKIYAIESSSLMREQAQKLQDGLFQTSNIEFIKSAKEIPHKDKTRLVVFTNSFNEMGEELALNYIKDLKADHILFIEPGTKESFKNLLELRERLIQKEFNVIYPCSSSGPCPLREEDDWCHQYVKLDLDLDIKRIAQLVKINKKWQAMSLFLFSREELEKTPAIVLRSYPPTKFSIEWDICRENQISRYQNKKRDFSKSDYKALKNVLSGDILNI